MTGIFHACFQFMNRKIGLISFFTAVFVNKHVKSVLFDKIEDSDKAVAVDGAGRDYRNHKPVNKKAMM